jgi:Family of unknown function (DUF5996)
MTMTTFWTGGSPSPPSDRESFRRGSVGEGTRGGIGAAGQWPALPLERWKDTYDTLHMWTQIVGKIRLALTPLINHWWNVPFYVNARGLTTSAIPYRSHPFELTIDFLDHELVLQLSEGSSERQGVAIAQQSAAAFPRARDLELFIAGPIQQIRSSLKFSRWPNI